MSSQHMLSGVILDPVLIICVPFMEVVKNDPLEGSWLAEKTLYLKHKQHCQQKAKANTLPRVEVALVQYSV